MILSIPTRLISPIDQKKEIKKGFEELGAYFDMHRLKDPFLAIKVDPLHTYVYASEIRINMEKRKNMP